MSIILSHISNFTIMYTLRDYYSNLIPDDLEYWNYDEEQRQIEQCYEKRQLQKDVDDLIEERSWAASFRYMAIRRIAIEAHNKKVSQSLIAKFFKAYEIQPNERVWFWMEYYNYNNYK